MTKFPNAIFLYLAYEDTYFFKLHEGQAQAEYAEFNWFKI